MSDMLEEIVKAYAAVKIQQLHLKNYNGANLAYNHAADVANKLGLSPEQKLGITPYPSPTSTNINIGGEAEQQAATETPAPKRTIPPWVWSALSALGGGSIVGGAITVGSWWLNRDETPPPQPAPPAAEQPQEQPQLPPLRDASVGLEVEGWNSQ